MDDREPKPVSRDWKVISPTPKKIASLFRRSHLSIRHVLVACFAVIVLTMLVADTIAVWQFRQMAVPAERYSKADEVSHAVIRVHLDVDTFRDRMIAVAESHDADQFTSQAAAIRQTFLEDVDHAKQMLGATSNIAQDPVIGSALESLRVTLPAQLDSAVQLATASDWDAIRLRLGKQIPALIEFSSVLVERVDQQLSQERDRATKDIQQARQRFFKIVPIAAFLTLLTAVALGWFVIQSITVPLSQLKHGAEALARGDFHHRVAVGGSDELAVVGKAFDYAAQQLQQLYEDLRRSEQSLREVINTVPAHVWSASPDGAVDFVNERSRKFIGLPPDEIMGWNWESVLHPDDQAGFVAEWRGALKEGHSMEAEARVRRADGQYSWFFIRNVPLRDEAGNIIKWYGSGIEIEDRKRAEEERERLRELEAELAHLNRVSMMAVLAASVSHEIKQPIAAAIINARTCVRWLARDPPDLSEACAAAQLMEKDGVRAAQIIDRMRSFYKKSAPVERELVDVNELAREMLLLLRNEASRYSISMRIDLAADLPKTMADRVQLQQVFMNLMLNGIEAMKDTGGELTIRSQDHEGQVLISVSDVGIGFPNGVPAHMFDAFFTTKPQGSGMGLAVSRSIIESYNGRLWAIANARRGATFYFTLPIAAEAAEAPATGT